jgi:hypothetical protein
MRVCDGGTDGGDSGRECNSEREVGCVSAERGVAVI